LRNIAVALSGSACSGGSGPEFASFFAMRGRSYSNAGRAYCEDYTHATAA
jgi:hypothetical protein